MTTTSLPSGVAGQPYSGRDAAVVRRDRPGHVDGAAGLAAAGLSLSSAGAISGTPTTAGTFDFTVTATDSARPAQTATKSLSITIAGSLA